MPSRVLAQDVAHLGSGTHLLGLRQRLGRYLLMAGFGRPPRIVFRSMSTCGFLERYGTILKVWKRTVANDKYRNRCSTMTPTTPALLASISIAWTLRGKPSSTGIRCNSWARFTTPLR